ncbi:MAG: hypothetical protein JKX70_09850 [Phycisphaerales bacterium]|nr:hypothetical protein [Phycisphaerales bacterium]
MGWNQPKKLNEPVWIQTPSNASPCALRACASFGLIIDHQPLTHTTQPKITHPSPDQLSRIQSSSTVLLTGASGSGKSSLLRGIRLALLNEHNTVHYVNDSPTTHNQSIAMIDQLTGPLTERLTTLSHCGLAEPSLWAQPPSCLSVGQRARLNLAVTMHSAHPGDTVIADEFATSLDRANAYALAKTMARWAKNAKVTLIAATPHEDMEAMLNPDLVIDLNTNTTKNACNHVNQPIQITTGSIADYHTLAHLHYRSAQPATHTLILKASRTVPILGSILAGVLVISMPTLNSSWRDRAWPGFFTTTNKSLNAKRINTHLRCISRVIVEPRSRGLGVASSLVRHYLANPQTHATESIAAMGAVCPFFERASMTPYQLPHTPVDLRLLDALEHQQLTLDKLIRTSIEPNTLIARELITWSKARRIIGSGTPDHQTVKRLAPIAACRLLASPRAYAHVHNDLTMGNDKDEQTRLD